MDTTKNIKGANPMDSTKSIKDANLMVRGVASKATASVRTARSTKGTRITKATSLVRNRVLLFSIEADTEVSAFFYRLILA